MNVLPVKQGKYLHAPYTEWKCSVLIRSKTEEYGLFCTSRGHLQVTSAGWRGTEAARACGTRAIRKSQCQEGLPGVWGGGELYSVCATYKGACLRCRGKARELQWGPGPRCWPVRQADTQHPGTTVTLSPTEDLGVGPRGKRAEENAKLLYREWRAQEAQQTSPSRANQRLQRKSKPRKSWPLLPHPQWPSYRVGSQPCRSRPCWTKS